MRPGPVDGLDSGDDVRLIAQVADGQSGALAELYRRRGGALLRFVQRILGDAPDAEEVLQDAFLQVWQRAATFDAARARRVRALWGVGPEQIHATARDGALSIALRPRLPARVFRQAELRRRYVWDGPA